MPTGIPGESALTTFGMMLLIPADIGRFGLWIEVGGLVLGLIWLWRRYSERAARVTL